MSPNVKEAMLLATNAMRNIVELAAGDDRGERIETAKRQLQQAMVALDRIQGAPQDGPVYVPVYVPYDERNGWGG